MSGYVGRLAPSPTGALHLGNARTFMIAWLRARSQGGKIIFRMEDLDHPKDKPGAAVQAVEDLKWLGFDWDEEYVQSERKDIYREALESLGDLVYPCVCSRKDVESAQSAPHAGEQLYYPGTCRDRFKSWAAAFSFLNKHRDTETQREEGNALCLCDSVLKKSSRLPCWRFRVPGNSVVSFDDAFAGHYEQDVSRTLGDFPLARDEFGAGYTLACAVDDLLMGVTEVVRGDDLLAATPAQILLVRELTKWFKHRDTYPPSEASCEAGAMRGETQREGGNALCLCDSVLKYCHVPLVVGKDGKRLAKRHGDTRIATFREAGKTPEELIGFLAASCGWAAKGERVSLAELVPRFDLGTIPHSPFMI